MRCLIRSVSKVFCSPKTECVLQFTRLGYRNSLRPSTMYGTKRSIALQIRVKKRKEKRRRRRRISDQPCFMLKSETPLAIPTSWYRSLHLSDINGIRRKVTRRIRKDKNTKKKLKKKDESFLFFFFKCTLDSPQTNTFSQSYFEVVHKIKKHKASWPSKQNERRRRRKKKTNIIAKWSICRFTYRCLVTTSLSSRPCHSPKFPVRDESLRLME